MESNCRVLALKAILWVVLEKKSLSLFAYPEKASALTKSLVFGTIRFYHQLNDIVSGLLEYSLKKEDLDIHCLILLGAYQILYSNVATHASIFETVNVANELNKPWAKKLANAILREINRQKNALQKQIHYSHPTWLFKKIKQYYPGNFEQIFKQNNTQAPMTIRLHPEYNIDIHFDVTKIKIAPQARILTHAVNVHHIQGFDKGSCFVQDASAQLAAPLLNPKNDDLILDACCAPGGKTTHLSELVPQSKIIALDSDADRLKHVQENIERFSIKNIRLFQGKAQTQDWWDGKLFDKILLDAPCSATGVIRRHPDIKLLRKPKDISVLVALQKDILNNLWTMLKPGGTLLYATCSILKNENEEQIAQFLQNHSDAIEKKIMLDWGLETTHGKQQIPCYEFDGFYYAILKKLV